MEENRPAALTALSWVVVNRKAYEGWWDGTYAEIASDPEFNAVASNPNYQPTDGELEIACKVLDGEIADPTGGSVYFHDHNLPTGNYNYKIENIVEYEADGETRGQLWGLYFYTSAQCPEGPDSTKGCSQK